MRLRDILIGGEVEVEEHSGSRFLQPSDLVYGRICRLPDVNTLTCMAPVAIPPGRKADVIALRAWLRQGAARQDRELNQLDLFRYAEKIRLTYLAIRDSLHAPPRLCNTDGETLEFHTLTWRAGSAQVAFDALAPLAWGWTKEELLEDAEIGSDGALHSVEIDWVKKGNKMHKHWDNTILGHIKISDRSLTVDVNSANRAAKIAAEIEKRLGMLAVPLGTRVKTQNELLKEAKARPAAGAVSGKAEDPQLTEISRTLMQEETDAWVHRRIPILGGHTPLEAVNDPEGKTGDRSPNLSRDGRLLYFASDRPGGKGGLDVWAVQTATLAKKK